MLHVELRNKMEVLMSNIANFLRGHSNLMESINILNDDALQNLQNSIMEYINYLCGDIIEEQLRMDPQFSHLFENKQDITVSSDKKYEYVMPKKIPISKISNGSEPQKLFGKVDAKSKMIKNSSKTMLKNVAHVKDILDHNLGSFFLNTSGPKFLKYNNNEKQRIYQEFSSLVPYQAKNIQCTEKDCSKSKNQTFLILNKSQTENSVNNNNLSDRDMHYWYLNENIQQNEIYVSNSDHENNVGEILSTKSETNYSDNLTKKHDLEKEEINKISCQKTNKLKLFSENTRKLGRVENKRKINKPSAYDIEKYLKMEELKKIDRYKYNSGGYFKFCKDSLNEKCVHSLENFKGKDTNTLLQKNIHISKKKDAAPIIFKKEVKCNILRGAKLFHTQNKVVVENLPARNLQSNEGKLKDDFESSKISKFSIECCSKKIEQDDSKLDFDRFGFSSQQNEILPENIKKLEKKTRKINVGESANASGESKDTVQCLNIHGKTDEDFEENALTEKDNVDADKKGVKFVKKEDTNLQITSETSVKSIHLNTEDHAVYNLYACPIKKYSSKLNISKQVIQCQDDIFDKMENYKHSTGGVTSDEKTGRFSIITVNKKDSSLISNTNTKISNKQLETVQQTVNSVVEKYIITDKVQLNNESLAPSKQPEINNCPNSLKNIDIHEIIEPSIENTSRCSETTVRRSSLRNKTGLIMKNNVETHMLVKITYDKGDVKQSDDIHKEHTNTNSKEIGRYSRNSEIKRNTENNQTKPKKYYLRSSITRIHK